MIVFAICSCINTSAFSVFSTEERYKQTLDTIKSIRENIENSYIILCENSPISSNIKEELTLLVDKFISLYDNEIFYSKISPISYKNGKSIGELYQMLNCIEVIIKLDYDIFFKISGRYKLTNKFDLNKFNNNKINFREFNHGGLCFSTVLYSFCKSHETIMENKFLEISSVLNNKDIEWALHSLKNNNNTNLLDYLGVCGYISPDGNWIEH